MFQRSGSPSQSGRPQLVHARLRYGWTQQELAERLGTTPLNVSRWERRLTTPSPYFRQKLCDLFQVEAHELNELLDPEGKDAISSSQFLLPEQETRHHEQPVLDPTFPLLLHPLIGRERELDVLKAHLLHETYAPRVALQGLPGVGKTALALALLSDPQVRARFPDGLLWADLGADANLTSILVRWCRLLGLSEHKAAVLTNPQDLTRQLQLLSAGRNMLLLLDDVWQAEAVLACQVAGSQCGYVLTTRFPKQALAFAPTSTLVVKELELSPSLELLTRNAPYVASHAAANLRPLVHAVGGLPLALTLMGHYLGAQSHNQQPRRIRAALQHLQQAPARLHLSVPQGISSTLPSLPGSRVSLHAVIATSELSLSPAVQTSWHALALLPAKPASFSEAAALAVSAMSLECLDELSDAGMLESAGPGRYTLHQTLADYGRAQLAEQEQSAVSERLINYGLSLLEAPGQTDEMLEQESRVLLTALELAYTRKRFAELARGVLALVPFWLARGNYSLAREQLHRASQAAEFMRDAPQLVRVWRCQGDVAQQLGELAQAQQWYQQGLALARQLNHIDLISHLLADLGSLAAKIGKYHQMASLQENLILVLPSYSIATMRIPLQSTC